LEYPAEGEGAHIACPQCGQQTQLDQTALPQTPGTVPEFTLESIDTAFDGVVARTPVSFLYKLGLLVVTLAMVTLPLIYIGMIGAAGWAVYYWATH